MMKSKYGNRKVKTSDGLVFDSQKEAQRYGVLKLLERAGEIQDLQRQVRFTLIPEQRMPDTLGPKGGRRKGMVMEKACTYLADFVYTENGKTIVEDCKGHKTEVYRIKKKLMLWVHDISIRET